MLNLTKLDLNWVKKVQMKSGKDLEFPIDGIHLVMNVGKQYMNKIDKNAVKETKNKLTYSIT